MDTVTLPRCVQCRELIMPFDGVLIQGNVYMVTGNPDERAGLIGNAFPTSIEEIEESGGIESLSDFDSLISIEAWHTSCLTQYLEWARR